MVTDKLQTIPTHTDMLYIYSTVEGMCSPLTQAGSCSPTSPTTPDPCSTPPGPTLLQAFLYHTPHTPFEAHFSAIP